MHLSTGPANVIDLEKEAWADFQDDCSMGGARVGVGAGSCCPLFCAGLKILPLCVLTGSANPSL